MSTAMKRPGYLRFLLGYLFTSCLALLALHIVFSFEPNAKDLWNACVTSNMFLPLSIRYLQFPHFIFLAVAGSFLSAEGQKAKVRRYGRIFYIGLVVLAYCTLVPWRAFRNGWILGINLDLLLLGTLFQKDFL